MAYLSAHFCVNVNPMATIKEIAELAKVSIGTVDRVIHNRGRVSKETEKKIKAIIDELNYQPNFFAKNLKLSKEFNFNLSSFSI